LFCLSVIISIIIIIIITIRKVPKVEGKEAIERPRFKWEEDNKMDDKGIGYESVDWIHVAQDMFHCRAVVCMIMELWVS
jgi:hypothetical protein